MTVIEKAKKYAMPNFGQRDFVITSGKGSYVFDENGKKYCKPRNNVTYCEAVQLMYSIMKVYSGQDVNDATVTKWKPVISAYNIPEWAYKATAYALENSILTTGELNKLQGNANKINTKAATREDVGVIFGKALDTVKGYDIKSGATLSYADKSTVQHR